MAIDSMELRKHHVDLAEEAVTNAQRFLARRDPAQLGQARRCLEIAEREMMLAESCGDPLVAMRDTLAAARFEPVAAATVE